MAQKKKRADKVDKRLRARVRVGEDAQGKAVYKWVSGATKAALSAARADVLARYRSGEDADKVTFGAYAGKWYSGRKPELSESAKRAYKSVLNKHLLPVLGARRIRRIAHSDLQALLNGTDLAHGTVNQIRVVMRMVFASAKMDGLIDRDPSEGLSVRNKAVPPKRRALTPEETALLLQACDQAGSKMLVYLLFYLGLRHGEAVGVKWEDIDWSARTICIQRDVDPHTNQPSTTKTVNANRTIPIPQPLFALLRDHRGIGWVLPGSGHEGQLSQRQVINLWTDTLRAMCALAKQRGVSLEVRPNGLPVLTPHYLRHNYATMLYDAGVDVLQAQAWLGHANATTTMGIYTHLSKEKQVRNTVKLDDFFASVAASLPDATTNA